MLYISPKTIRQINSLLRYIAYRTLPMRYSIYAPVAVEIQDDCKYLTGILAKLPPEPTLVPSFVDSPASLV